MYIFNPEHDICTANGDPNFVPPHTALEFGENCSGLPRWIKEAEKALHGPAAADACEEESHPREIIPWGWDCVLKRRLRKAGVPENLLPSDGTIETVRTLSHRGVALQAKEYIKKSAGSGLLTGTATQMHSVEEVAEAVETLGSVVLKAPWSGSGRGLRRVRRGEFHPSDRGWCGRVIARQGSIIVERREQVVQDFAMLFSVGPDGVRFEGYSLFFCENCAYRGNLLASDGAILQRLAGYVPVTLLSEVRLSLTRFLEERFTGRYEGYVGADMFICTGEGGGFLLNPCVELNVRMTMGLLARRVYDLGVTDRERFIRLLAETSPEGAALPVLRDGEHRLRTVYCPGRGGITEYIRSTGAVPLHGVTEENRYAVVIL